MDDASAVATVREKPREKPLEKPGKKTVYVLSPLRTDGTTAPKGWRPAGRPTTYDSLGGASGHAGVAAF